MGLIKNNFFEFVLIVIFTVIAFIFPMECYPFEYSPSAEIEKNQIKIDLFSDYSFCQQGEVIINILNEKGVHDYGQVIIPYSESLESFEILDAHTVKNDGKIVPVLAGRIFTKESSISAQAPVFSDTKLKVIVFSEIEIGSKLFYKYKMVRKKPIIPKTFQFFISISPHIKNFVDIRINAPENVPIYVDKRGFSEVEHGAHSGKHYWRFVSYMKIVNPPESNELTGHDIGNSIFLSSIENYEKISTIFTSLWRKRANVTPIVKSLAKEITGGEKDTTLQARLIYNWVSRNIRYVAVHIGIGSIQPHEASEVIANKYGDCKDHSVLLEALLRAKGIESMPALINNSRSFSLPNVGTLDVFNHVITYVPTLKLFLDSTSGYAPFGVLPSTVIDKFVLLSYVGQIDRTPIPEINLRASSLHLRVLPDGSIEGNSKESFKGAVDVTARSTTAALSGKTDEELIYDHLSRNKLTGSGKVDRGKPELLDISTIRNTDFHLETIKHLSEAGIFIIPTVFGSNFIQQIKMITNINKRIFPFFCDSAQYQDDYEIRFPNSYKILEIPRDIDKSYGPFYYQSNYELIGSILRVKRQYISKPVSLSCQPNVFESLKKIYSVIDKDISSPVKYTSH